MDGVRRSKRLRNSTVRHVPDGADENVILAQVEQHEAAALPQANMQNCPHNAGEIQINSPGVETIADRFRSSLPSVHQNAGVSSEDLHQRVAENVVNPREGVEDNRGGLSTGRIESHAMDATAEAASAMRDSEISPLEAEHPEDQEIPAMSPARRQATLRANRDTLAQRRARHFAFYSEDRQDAWPGPFTTGRDLLEGRVNGNDDTEEGGEAKTEALVETPVTVDWEPKHTEKKGGRVNVETLLNACVRVLTTYSDCIESMEGVPETIMQKLCASFCKRRKLSGKCIKLFVTTGRTDIRIPDCSMLSETEMIQTLRQTSPDSIQTLHLKFSGRCMSDSVLASSLCSSVASLPNLKSVSLNGAYRMSDEGLRLLAESAPALMDLDLKDCSFISHKGIEMVAEAFGSQLESLNLEGCNQLDPKLLVKAFHGLTGLKSLSLGGMERLTDETLLEMLSCSASGLLELTLNDCMLLSEDSVKAIVFLCIKLERLSLDRLQCLTDACMESLASSNCSLKSLSVKEGKFNDSSMAAFIAASGQGLHELYLNSNENVGDLTMVALASHCHSSLKYLDVSFCRQLSENGAGLMADTCACLETLVVFGCSQITDRFLNGHSNLNLEVIGI